MRFSADGKEIVGGASAESRRSDNDGKIVGSSPFSPSLRISSIAHPPLSLCCAVYDLEKNAPTLMIDAHEDDVNSVCWADKQSKHILCSASDDGYVKIWDRRSLSSGKPSGVLVGHTEGITTVDAKGTPSFRLDLFFSFFTDVVCITYMYLCAHRRREVRFVEREGPDGQAV